MGKGAGKDELEPYNVGELVEVSLPTGDLRKYDGEIGVIIARRMLIDTLEELPDKGTDQDSFRNLNCWEYEVLLRGDLKWITHYSLLKYIARG